MRKINNLCRFLSSRKFLKNKNGKNLRDGNICFTFAVLKLLTIKKTA